MVEGLEISLDASDPDYLGLNLVASNGRFAGSAWVYAGLDSLAELANRIQEFPSGFGDQRTYEFGTREAGYAGGYCQITFPVLIVRGTFR